MDRQKIIIKTSITGILANLFLAAFKAFVGIISSSIAVLLDAVNNLSDALSSIITIVGTKLAAKSPDKKHPFGHGRIEYISALVIAVIILYAGITSLSESIKKIINPQKPNYTLVNIIIIAVAVLVKILLGLYVKKQGKKANSNLLVASGKDALMDAMISTGTLVAAIIFTICGLSLEAYMAALISIFIIKSGIDTLRETISEILGKRVESSLAKSIKKSVGEIEGIEGVYDLVFNNYGPDIYLADMHIEVPESWTARKVDETTRTIQALVYEKYHVFVSAVGIYSKNVTCESVEKIKTNILEIIGRNKYILQLHGFYVDEEKKNIFFDLVVDFAAPDRKAVFKSVHKEVQEAYPDYTLYVQMDSDVSD